MQQVSCGPRVAGGSDACTLPHVLLAPERAPFWGHYSVMVLNHGLEAAHAAAAAVMRSSPLTCAASLSELWQQG